MKSKKRPPVIFFVNRLRRLQRGTRRMLGGWTEANGTSGKRPGDSCTQEHRGNPAARAARGRLAGASLLRSAGERFCGCGFQFPCRGPEGLSPSGSGTLGQRGGSLLPHDYYRPPRRHVRLPGCRCGSLCRPRSGTVHRWDSRGGPAHFARRRAARGASAGRRPTAGSGRV